LRKKGFVQELVYVILIIAIILILAWASYTFIIGKKSQIGFLESLAEMFKSKEEKRVDELKNDIKGILDLKSEDEVNSEYDRILGIINEESQKQENINLIVKYEELKFELEKTKELALLNIEFDKIRFPAPLNELKNKYEEFSKLPDALSELKVIAEEKRKEIEKIESCNFEIDKNICNPDNSKGYCFLSLNVREITYSCTKCVISAMQYSDPYNCVEDPCKTISEEQKGWKETGWYPETKQCRDFCEYKAIDRRKCCRYVDNKGIINFRLTEVGEYCKRDETEVKANYCCGLLK